MKNILLLLICAIITLNCKKTEPEYSPEIEAKAQKMLDSMMVEAKRPEGKETTWQYRNDVDKMGDNYRFAEVQSSDILEFGSPYSGGSVSTLVVRKKGSDISIMYSISNGQIVSANVVDGGSVRVRFDNEEPRSYSISTSSDGSSDVFFFDSEEILLKKIKKANKMVLEVEFYREGLRQIEFNVEGLKDF